MPSTAPDARILKVHRASLSRSIECVVMVFLATLVLWINRQYLERMLVEVVTEEVEQTFTPTCQFWKLTVL